MCFDVPFPHNNKSRHVSIKLKGRFMFFLLNDWESTKKLRTKTWRLLSLLLQYSWYIVTIISIKLKKGGFTVLIFSSFTYTLDSKSYSNTLRCCRLPIFIIGFIFNYKIDKNCHFSCSLKALINNHYTKRWLLFTDQFLPAITNESIMNNPEQF